MKKSKSLLTTATITALLISSAIIVLADCDYLKSGNHCGANDVPASCLNFCYVTTYYPDGPSQTCTSITDDFWACGYTPCTTKNVGVTKEVAYLVQIYENGVCIGCVLPKHIVSETPVGTCEQDSINPITATQCGPCGVN